MAGSQAYIKIMVDIIDSGLWARLSVGARTLYPVLLKFSDQNFKQVWPSTSTLMKLTGFKTKKSIIEAKKDLIEAGLIQVKTGKGHTNSTYYFCFNYEGSKITPHWDKNLHPEGIKSYTPREDFSSPQRSEKANPNQINISITNTNQVHKPKNDGAKEKKDNKQKEENSYDSLIETYGPEVFSYAYKEAKKRGLETQIAYLKAVCKERTIYLSEINFNQKNDKNKSSWFDFLSWASSKLTQSSISVLQSLNPTIEGDTIYIQEEISDFLLQVIKKYFEEMDRSKIIITKEKTTSRID